MKILAPVRWPSALFFAFALTGSARAQPATSTPPPVTIPDLTSYILTPAPAHTPRITGAKVHGQRPGSPFRFTLTATGDRPMTFSAEGLPAGLKFDPATGQITGKVAQAGSFTLKVGAKNALGAATRELKIVIGEQISLTPPMGWNSWNSWAGDVDQGKVLRSAHALVSSGLVNHGWTYVNIDDTWQGTRTGLNRALLANGKFPDLKGLCDELHAMGLKAGLYSTPWVTSYASYPGGSSDHPAGTWDKATLGNDAAHRIGQYHFAAADAVQYAAWGFDYLKYDWQLDVPTTQEMSEALRKTGRDIVFSLSNNAPFGGAADWARLAQAWRTSGDITDTWSAGNMSWNNGIAKIGFAQDRWAPFAGPGHWNDPDMLVIGVVSLAQPMHFTHLTPDEQYTHLSLWSLLAAPLLIGCDLERVDPFTLSLLTNDEVLDVDQDPLGKAAVRVAGPAFTVPPETSPTPTDNPGGNGLVYARPLEDGTLAVGLFNVGPCEEKVTATWQALGVDGQRVVRDLWRQKDLGVFENEFSATVPSHGVVLVKVRPTPKVAERADLISPLSPLKVEGTRIVDRHNQPVRLRGVNVASLEWTSDGEGRILQTVNVAIRDWHVNIIRLPLSQDRWFGKTPEQADGGQAYRALVRQVVDTCATQHCYIILDLHWSDCNEWGENIGQHSMPDLNSVAFWKDLAPVYANHPAVIFDLYNEPHHVSWEVWLKGGTITDKPNRHFMVARTYECVGLQALLDAVRETGAMNLVIAGGLDWAYDFSGILDGRQLVDPKGNGVVYASHCYDNKDDRVDAWIAKLEKAAARLPVIVSEFGGDSGPSKRVPADNWLLHVMQAIEDHQWSYCAWDLHPRAGPTLIADWNYTPTPLFGVYVKQMLDGTLPAYTPPPPTPSPAP